MLDKLKNTLNHVRAEYRYIFYADIHISHYHDNWFDAPFTSLLDYTKEEIRKHPRVYTFHLNEFETINLWDDPELYERSIVNVFSRTNWKGGSNA